MIICIRLASGFCTQELSLEVKGKAQHVVFCHLPWQQQVHWPCVLPAQEKMEGDSGQRNALANGLHLPDEKKN